MNCQSFENCLMDVARQRPFDARTREQALAHAESCDACALRLHEQRSLTSALRGLADEMNHIELPDRIGDELVAAVRMRSGSAQTRGAIGRAWIAAIAAVVLIAVGAVGLRWRSASPATSTVANTGPSTTEPPPKTGELSSDPMRSDAYSDLRNEENARPVRRKPPSEHPRKIRQHVTVAATNANLSVPAVATEVTTAFMPMADLSVASLQDGAQVVRVEMPRYAMARFGLPVNMDRYDEKVKADVWVGVDGLARAIRFVQ